MLFLCAWPAGKARWDLRGPLGFEGAAGLSPLGRPAGLRAELILPKNPKTACQSGKLDTVCPKNGYGGRNLDTGLGLGEAFDKFRQNSTRPRDGVYPKNHIECQDLDTMYPKMALQQRFLDFLPILSQACEIIL